MIGVYNLWGATENFVKEVNEIVKGIPWGGSTFAKKRKNGKEKFQGHGNGVRRMRGQSEYGIEQPEGSETRLRQFRVGKSFSRIR